MPTYEYECSKCGKVFELFQSIKESPRKKLRAADPKPCNCNAAVSRRISTGGGLIFKGSGFYLTDYRSESYKEKAQADTGTADSKSADTKSADAKPAETKKEAKPAETSGVTKPARKKPKSK